VLFGQVRRMVILKADGLPGSFLEHMVSTPATATGGKLPRIRQIFVENGVWIRNFYSRGVSLSVPSWSILDTGQPLAIRGNVEYDRYTLRAFDYVNYFPFYLRSAVGNAADMPAVEVLDDLGVKLLRDRFVEEETYQGLQVFQRGVPWETLRRAARSPFRLRSPRRLIEEWQTGFELSRKLWDEVERDAIRAIGNPGIVYVDLFFGEFDHLAHVDNGARAQETAATELDSLAGRLWSAIETSPLLPHTLFILVSDHGMNSSPHVISQGYNLVEFLRSAAGGGHHVVTNRHPLADYKLKGLYPFVHKVSTASPASPYKEGASAKDYPTALLDLDGNERAAVYLRNSDINLVHLLGIALERRDLSGRVRSAARDAYRRILLRYLQKSRPRIDRLKSELDILHGKIGQLQSLLPRAPTNLAQRRIGVRIDSWQSDERSYREVLAAVERMQSKDTRTVSRVIPKRWLGEPNSVHQLQNYIVGINPEGLQLATDGSLDLERSFLRVNYFSRLISLTVRNVIQAGLGNRPVDFVAMRVPASSLARALPGEDRPTFAVWLHAGADRQLLVLARGDPVELKVVPVAELREDASGAVTFEPMHWRAGLPLQLLEDTKFDVAPEERTSWLAGWHSEREWMRKSHAARYSNAVISLFEQFRDSLPTSGFPAARRALVHPEFIVFARNHWNFNTRGFNPGGNHGGFFRESTRAVLLMRGGAATGVRQGVVADEPYDTLSFVPTVLSLMGRCDSSLPGTVIHEVGTRPGGDPCP
jgi:hypothetical protein